MGEPREARAGGEEPARRRSRWWYLAPLLLSIVGGVVAYFALRGDDSRMALRCLVLGGAMTAACVAIQAALLAGALLP